MRDFQLIYARGALSQASEPKKAATVVKYHGFNNISILQRGGPSMLARGLLGQQKQVEDREQVSISQVLLKNRK